MKFPPKLTKSTLPPGIVSEVLSLSLHLPSIKVNCYACSTVFFCKYLLLHRSLMCRGQVSDLFRMRCLRVASAQRLDLPASNKVCHGRCVFSCTADVCMVHGVMGCASALPRTDSTLFWNVFVVLFWN